MALRKTRYSKSSIEPHVSMSKSLDEDILDQQRMTFVDGKFCKRRAELSAIVEVRRAFWAWAVPSAVRIFSDITVTS